MSTKEKSKTGFLDKLAGCFGGGKALEVEKARLEAFLDAVPGEYCGWNPDDTMVSSEGFASLLGRDSVRHLADIQSALAPGDAAALEGVWSRLRENGESFNITAHSHDGSKTFQLSGARGKDFFNILWVQDVTKQSKLETNDAEQQDQEIEKLKAALDYLPASVWLRNERQELILCNDTYAKIVKSSPEDIIAQQKEIAPPPKKKKKSSSDPVPGAALAEKALKESETQIAQAHVISGGDRLLMKIFEIPISSHNMTLGVARDITGEEEIATELQRYKAVNQELLQQLRTAIAIYDADQKLVFYNTAFAQLWDLDDGWLNTRPKLGDIMEKLRETRRLPEQSDFRKFRQSWIDMFTRLLDPHEDMLHLPDGSALRMLVIPNPMGGMMMTFEDVTSGLELESSYNTLIAVQKETLDNLAEAVAVYGGDGRLKLWNPSFGRLWGLNPEDLDGEPHISRIVEKFKPFFTAKEWGKEQEELVSLGLDRIMHEGRHERADETLIDYVTVPLPDGGVLITYGDVTDTVRVENALREKNAALEAAEQLKLDFLANVSYQLRTPLNAIMGFNEILDQEFFGSLNERQKVYTHDIKDASDTLLGLINDILDLATIEAGYMTLNKGPIKIKDMLESLVELVSDWARKEHIEVSLSCPKTIGALNADETRLKQAIINLIRNALTYTPEGGKIALSAKRKKDGIELSVSDTGIGIAKEDQGRILEPFVRASNPLDEKSKTRGGAGLGLSLVKNIVALHGGTLDLASERGKGTSVTLFLPFEPAEQDAKKSASKQAA